MECFPRMTHQYNAISIELFCASNVPDVNVLLRKLLKHSTSELDLENIEAIIY